MLGASHFVHTTMSLWVSMELECDCTVSMATTSFNIRECQIWAFYVDVLLICDLSEDRLVILEIRTVIVVDLLPEVIGDAMCIYDCVRVWCMFSINQSMMKLLQCHYTNAFSFS